ncbi:alginate lyase family protein [uncultured Flavobacterium sp.]|uniref:alginate lyase family protein n=1 Tax=uncultured Flavobacterium sp. TaxID=165435 RepID=UPI0025982E27|nr:alginate lyase family protein [uncultured Flavobacterium sp.]
MQSGAQPWTSAWQFLESNYAQKTYSPNAVPVIQDLFALTNDGHAAYILAVKWAVSGDVEYAKSSIKILDAWANTVTGFDLGINTTLRVGIGSIPMANAAEIIAHYNNGAANWPKTQQDKMKSLFKNVLFPCVNSSSTEKGGRSGNWGTAPLDGIIAMAIFCEDMEMLKYGYDAYFYGFPGKDGCAGVAQYIWHENGQDCESGRDQGHPQGGVSDLVEAALALKNQGFDVVPFARYRLVAGIEYLAKYNLGNDVTFYKPMPNPCGNYPASYENGVSPNNKGEFAPIYEMASYLFGDQPHPFTKGVIASSNFRYYPNTATGGVYLPERSTGDSPGCGTLLYRK